MLHSHITSPDTPNDLHDRAPNTPVSKVRHGRLFELLRHDTSVENSGEDAPALRPRKEFKMTDDEMLAFQSASVKTLHPREF